MTTERITRLMAGTFVLVGTGLAFFTQNPAWLVVPGFVGLNLAQSSFTGFCPAESIVRALGTRDAADLRR